MMERSQMAGEWIKIESVTPDKPEVFQMAEILGIDPDAVVGKLLRIWVWADQQTIDGNARGVTRALLDRLTSAAGFADALVSVGWLVDTDDGLTFPRFGEHNGKTAKSRALGAKRASKSRSERDGSVTGALQGRDLEKSREEKSIEEEEKKTPPPSQRVGDVAEVGPVILTETAEGGGGILRTVENGQTDDRERQAPVAAKTWQTLTAALTSAGLNMAGEAARWARKHGATPEHCFDVLDHWRANPGAWTVGIIYTRFKDPQLCNRPPAAGWPNPAARVITTNGEHDARERQADQIAMMNADKQRAAESRGEVDQLIAEHGDAIDELSDDDRAALLPAGSIRDTLKRRGWRTPTIRGRVLRAYVETYLAEPVTN